MLILKLGGAEVFDEKTSEFIKIDTTELHLEHSLFAVSKWESVYEKPFLAPGEKTTEEVFFYIECMIVSGEHSPGVMSQILDEDMTKINEYLQSKQTATWFNESAPAARNSEVITAELVYYWMVMYNIPFECQHWHINRLFTLIKVCNLKSAPPKKMSRADVAERNRQLNMQRRQQLGSSG